jgi:hypothetical protein
MKVLPVPGGIRHVLLVQWYLHPMAKAFGITKCSRIMFLLKVFIEEQQLANYTMQNITIRYNKNIAQLSYLVKNHINFVIK